MLDGLATCWPPACSQPWTHFQPCEINWQCRMNQLQGAQCNDGHYNHFNLASGWQLNQSEQQSTMQFLVHREQCGLVSTVAMLNVAHGQKLSIRRLPSRRELAMFWMHLYDIISWQIKGSVHSWHGVSRPSRTSDVPQHLNRGQHGAHVSLTNYLL